MADAIFVESTLPSPPSFVQTVVSVPPSGVTLISKAPVPPGTGTPVHVTLVPKVFSAWLFTRL